MYLTRLHKVKTVRHPYWTESCWGLRFYEVDLLGCATVFGESEAFRRKMSPPYLGSSRSSSPWRWRRFLRGKRRDLFKLQGVTTQNPTLLGQRPRLRSYLKQCSVKLMGMRVPARSWLSVFNTIPILCMAPNYVRNDYVRMYPYPTPFGAPGDSSCFQNIWFWVNPSSRTVSVIIPNRLFAHAHLWPKPHRVIILRVSIDVSLAS